MPRCRIGIVGAGGVAARHARTLAGLPDVELQAVTDVDAERRSRFAAEFGARPVPDLAALLDGSPDAVYVCVPPFAHGAVEETVAAAGAALFVEKPLALDVTVAERVAAAVTAAGVVTAVGHHWRYSAAVRRAQELLAGRAVRLALGTWLDKVPPVPWWSSRAGSGGQVVEQAVHVLDLARVLVGEVREVCAFGDGTPPDAPADADIDGATVAALRFRCGAVGAVAATCRLGWKHRAGLEVCADGATLAITEDGLEARDAHGPTEHRVDPDTAKIAADRAFIDAVLGRGGVLVDYADALRTHRLACAVATAAAEARPVMLGG